MKKLLTLGMLSLAALLLLGAAACGDDDDDPADNGADVTDSATKAVDDTGAETATEDEGDDDGDDAPQNGNLNSYYEALEEIVVRSDDEQEEIGERLNSLSTTDEDYVSEVQEGFSESGQLLEQSILDISELDPPEEAQQAHDDFRESLQAALILLSQLSSEVDDATTSDEIDLAAEAYTPQLTAQNQVTEDACVELQSVADANEVDVDLRCLT